MGSSMEYITITLLLFAGLLITVPKAMYVVPQKAAECVAAVEENELVEMGTKAVVC
jgi:hypothetical protein